MDIKVENHSTELVTDFSVTNGFNTTYLDSISQNKAKTIFLDFKSDRKHSDGNYGIKYRKGNELYSSHFGYYSNGIPCN